MMNIKRTNNIILLYTYLYSICIIYTYKYLYSGLGDVSMGPPGPPKMLHHFHRSRRIGLNGLDQSLGCPGESGQGTPSGSF